MDRKEFNCSSNSHFAVAISYAAIFTNPQVLGCKIFKSSIIAQKDDDVDQWDLCSLEKDSTGDSR